MISAFVSSFFARSPNYGLTNCAFSGNIYRQPAGLQKKNMGVFPSGQWGQTVNLLLSASVVRIHPRPPRTPVSEPGTGVSVLSALQKGTQGWIRTATATTAASGRNREELLGLRPAGCACRPRHDAAAGSRDPGSLYSAARAIHPRPPRTPVSEPGTGVSVYLPHKRDARATRKIHSSPRRYCIYPRPVIPYR